MTTIINFPVDFHLRDSDPVAMEALMQRAAEIDLREAGEAQAEYTPEQAFVVVFHGDAAWLFTRPDKERILDGWTCDTPDGFWPSPEGDQYTAECGHCGTAINPDTGFDAVGSRRCDDLDPEHRYHEAADD